MDRPLGPTFAEIEAALGTLTRTLDQLTARGHDTTAFELARAQYAASIRHSWPGNLGTLVGILEKIEQNDSLDFSAEEREKLAAATSVLRQVRHP